MNNMMDWRSLRRPAAVLLLLLATASAAVAQDEESQRYLRKGNFDGMSWAEFKAQYPEYFPPEGSGRTRTTDIPDIFGPGAVLNVGNVYMKITNNGFNANPFTNLSSDPSGQWPGASGVEYLNFIGLAVGAVNPQATDPNAIRRVSYTTEFRPPTLDPVDKIYRAYDGIVNGQRDVNDDQDQDPATGLARIDEDFLDGRDNDGDGKIDEDFAAIGQQMFSCVMSDNTPQAINATANEKHVPLGVDVQQIAWAYSIPGFTDFDVIQWTVINRSGHTLDSLVVGGVVDMDCGPADKSNYYSDDFDLAGFPSGTFPHQTVPTDKRLQDSTMRAQGQPFDTQPDSALCSHFDITIHAFSVTDDDGDDGKTPGLPTFLLLGHTVDPLGDPAGCPQINGTGPSTVGFTAFRSYVGGTPYNQGGRPNTDQQRFELMVGTQPNGVDCGGNITQVPGDQKGDQVAWWSCGPWRNVADGKSVEVTVAFAVAPGSARIARSYPSDYLAYQGADPANQGALALAMFSTYPSLDNAYSVQVAYEGVYEDNPSWPYLTNGHGRETMLKPARGEPPLSAADCRDLAPRTVFSDPNLPPDWFDFDCNYCTGAYDSKKRIGMFHRTWNADAPPPNPALNVASSYNYTDNPDRIIPAGDSKVTLAWDNLSEATPDPKTGWLDFRGYRVWKAADWTRPVGSAGPSDDDWSLLAEFRQFYYYDPINNQLIPRNYRWQQTGGGDSVKVCPRVFVPNYVYPDGHRDTATVDICLDLGDLWDRQSGQVVKPADLPCVGDPICSETRACINGRQDCANPGNQEVRTRYPVGRYSIVDREVKNGFVYFYSVTAFDSTGSNQSKLELAGRRSAVEADGVVPQISTGTGKGVWVVPNPYRGYSNIQARPSAWDLTPNASDPTGTHVDFFGLPNGKWSIQIFTVSGDLVQTLHSEDAVNESIRSPVAGPGGTVLPGYNRQQDNSNDGQARWNLISRNGQDVVSGIYLFTVQSDAGTQRGKFVIIR